MHSIKIVDSIKDIKQEEWDSMIDDNAFASYGWLKTVEETYIGDINSRYILVQDYEKLVGAAVCYVFDKTDDIMNLDTLLLGRLKKYAWKLGISFAPALVCCPIFCYGKHLLVKNSADPTQKGIITDALLNAIENMASGEKFSVSFANVMDNEPELIKVLSNRGYSKALVLPLNYLDIEWASFEEYMGHLSTISRKMRRDVRRQINKNRKEGTTIERLDKPDRYEDRLHELINTHHYKYNRKPFMFRKELFSKLKENLREEVVFYTSFKRGIITGLCILFKRNRTGYLSIVGVDHEKTGNDFTYFNIAYYRPIADAISDKISRLYYGRAMYELKARRGCKTNNVYVYCRSFNKIGNIAVKPWFAFLSMWYKNKLPRRVKKAGPT